MIQPDAPVLHRRGNKAHYTPVLTCSQDVEQM